LVDIEEIMQRYVLLNDPNVKEITTKFGIALVGLGVLTVAVAGAVTWAGGGGTDAGSQAAYAEDDHDDKDPGDEVQDCVPSDEADAWRQANDDVLMENRLLDVESSDGWTCFTYVK
jgi:hypothetical protein